MDDLQQKLEELRTEKKRLLRGIGGRYSYLYRLKAQPKIDKVKVKRTSKKIKSVKNRLSEIADEIHDLKKQIERTDVSTVKSSERFNALYTDTLKEF